MSLSLSSPAQVLQISISCDGNSVILLVSAIQVVALQVSEAGVVQNFAGTGLQVINRSSSSYAHKHA